MARITASVYTSHVPAIGAAIDLGKTAEPYWQPVFKGYEFSKQWMKEQKPDVIFLVYNDHATAFSLDIIPTFAIGTAAEFAPADEGWGPRPVPKVIGHPKLAAPHRAVGDPGRFRPDHRQQDGRRPRPHRAAVADVRPAAGVAVPGDPVRRQRRAVPGALGPALLQLGKAIGKAIESYDEPLNVQIWGTGGMSHQLQGPRAGLINKEFDNRLPRSADRRSRGAVEDAAYRLRPRSRLRGHRAGDVADRARRHERCDRRRQTAHRAASLLPCARHQHRGGPSRFWRTTDMTKTIKVALAGAGAFGIKHLDGIKNIDGVEVVSLVGRRLEPTQEVAAKYGIAHVTTDLAESLALGGVDAVILCTPTQMHAAQSDRLPEGRQTRPGRNSAGRFPGRRAGGGRSAEADRAGGDVRPYPPLQSQPSMGAQQDHRRRLQHPADGCADLLLPPHQHERAGPAAQLDRPSAVAPRRPHGGPVRLPGGLADREGQRDAGADPPGARHRHGHVDPAQGRQRRDLHAQPVVQQ